MATKVSLENIHDSEVLPTLLNPLRRKLDRVYTDCNYDSKASHQLIEHKGETVYIPPRKYEELWKKGPLGAGDEKGDADALEEEIGVSLSFAGGDSDISVQTIDGRQTQSVKIQRSGGRGNGLLWAR